MAPAQKVNNPANVGAVTLTPLARFVRGLIQVVAALALAVPTILNTPAVAGNAVLLKYATVVGGYVLLVSAIINTLEHFGVIPVIGGKPSPVAVPEVGK